MIEIAVMVAIIVVVVAVVAMFGRANRSLGREEAREREDPDVQKRVDEARAKAPLRGDALLDDVLDRVSDPEQK